MTLRERKCRDHLLAILYGKDMSKNQPFFQTFACTSVDCSQKLSENHYLVLSQLQQQSKKITVHQERIQIMTWKSGCVAKIKQFSGPVPSRKRDAILGRNGGGDRRKITSLDLGLRLFFSKIMSFILFRAENHFGWYAK